ncbi:peptidoglycan-binding domain-containing protein [Streptomyces sp. NPDC051907]|uniref:peptidoglycan-binding domain-containing protein n=1 Tax=Streptomyces sp. NPDC051907 TaxID=3155284 RepID=UPI0034497931
MLMRQRTAVAAVTMLAGLMLAMTPGVAYSATSAAAPAVAVMPAAPAYCGYYDGSATTRRGDTGDRVREIQCLINYWAGGNAIAVDGAFGPRTESWVVHFQDVNGLQVDGVVGPQTWGALRAL